METERKTQIPKACLERQVEPAVLRSLGTRLREFARSWGAINATDEKEVVLWSKELGLEKEYAIISDNTDEGFFIALFKGNFLPTPSELYAGGHKIDQLDSPENFPKRFLNNEKSRIPIAGRVMIWDKEVSFEEAWDLLKKLYEVGKSKGLVDKKSGTLLAIDDTYFLPR